MRVAGVKARKISKKKAVLIVKFISPPSSKDVHIQLFCTSLGPLGLEPNTKTGQVADMSILTALKTTTPGAKSLFDFRKRRKPRSDTTRNMNTASSSMLSGTICEISQASFDDLETSEQNPFGDECHLLSPRDPVGFSRGAPDPRHHDQAMRSVMKAEWINS